MNKALYIVAVPAFILSFCWLYYAWGLKVAIVVTIAELVAAVWAVMYLQRKGAQPVASGQAECKEQGSSVGQEGSR